MCARNRRIRKGRWAALRGAADWVGQKVRTGILAIGLRGAALLALAAASLWGIHLARQAVGEHPRFRVYPRRFRAHAPPWCAEDLARVGFPRESYSIFDPALTREVAEAYAASPWVAAVRRVEKRLPNELVVELDLREPAAFVRLAQGYRAVDRDGAYLPLAYRSWDHQQRPLPSVYGVESEPPPPGYVWQAPGVQAALAVLRLLATDRELVEQIAIVDVTNLHGRVDPRESQINLFTRSWGHRVVIRWGASPDAPRSMEPRPATKLAMLRRCLARPLAVAGGASSIDLRFPDTRAMVRQ